jgi:D-alanyl-D-alanine endopeptidase (penicillin-binding protein 7)
MQKIRSGLRNTPSSRPLTQVMTAALTVLAVTFTVALPTSASAQSPHDGVAGKTAGAKSGHVAARRAHPVHARHVAAQPAEPARASFGQATGLHGTADPLALKSSVALVLDEDTNQVLFSKNPTAVLPIASITKLMTALVVTEAQLPLDEVIAVTQDDVDTEKHSGSRLTVGTQLSRGDMLHLALMSSENRAAHALGRNYPGGLEAFVAAMNLKAQTLGMHDTHYVEPTGLSSHNQSSANDLSLLVKAASSHRIIRELSTSLETRVAIGKRQVQFHTTNGLVRDPSWDISLQKTGYISEAGRCMVVQAQLAGRKLILVLLDSAGKYSRIADAQRIRKWLASLPLPMGSAAAATLAPTAPTTPQ